MSDLSFRIDEVESTASAASSGVDDLVSRVDELESQLEEVTSRLDSICDAVELNWIYSSNSAIEELLTDINDAC